MTDVGLWMMDVGMTDAGMMHERMDRWLTKTLMWYLSYLSYDVNRACVNEFTNK